MKRICTVLGILIPLYSIVQGKSHLDTVATPLTGQYDFTRLPLREAVALQNYSGQPNQNGILASYELSLPAFSKGCYFNGDRPDTYISESFIKQKIFMSLQIQTTFHQLNANSTFLLLNSL
jgi:hypothetical protein